jgi:hypothetical protein
MKNLENFRKGPFSPKRKTAGAREDDGRDETSRIKNPDKFARATLRASGLFAPGAKRVALQAASPSRLRKLPRPRTPLATRPLTTGPAETRPHESAEHHPGLAAATEHARGPVVVVVHLCRSSLMTR